MFYKGLNLWFMFLKCNMNKKRNGWGGNLCSILINIFIIILIMFDFGKIKWCGILLICVMDSDIKFIGFICFVVFYLCCVLCF